MYWDKTQDPLLAGIYFYLNRTAERVIGAGANGVIAMVADSSIVDKRGEVHEITKPGDIAKILGTDKSHAELVMLGGARKLIIYVRNDAESTADALENLKAYYFDAFALGYDAIKADADAVKAWREALEQEGKSFVGFAGADTSVVDDAGVQAVFSTAKHNDLAYVGFGGLDEQGNEYSGGELAAYLAGVQGSRGLAEGSLTRFAIPFLVDVKRRLDKAAREAYLTAGIIVPIHNGQEVVVDKAITSDATGFAKGKLRIAYNAAVYQEAIQFAIDNEFIGKINNDDAGRAVLLSAINKFNDAMIDARVLTPNSETTLHPDFESQGEEVYLLTKGEFIDAVEQVFFEFVASSQGGAV